MPEGNLTGVVNCPSGPRPPGVSTTDCTKACSMFASHVVGFHEKHDSGSCWVSVAQGKKTDFRGQVVSDACGQLVSACPDGANATSEFYDAKNHDYGGTLRVSYVDPGYPKSTDTGTLGSNTTESRGDYTLNQKDCADAVQAAMNGTRFVSSPSNATVGSCNATAYPGPAPGGEQGQPSNPEPSDWFSNAAQDLLNVPLNCNGTEFCRNYITGEIRNPALQSIYVHYGTPGTTEIVQAWSQV